MTGTGRRILIFEDNTNIQAILNLFFKKRGYEVRLADDGVDAVPIAKEFDPELILMDIIMPGKDGIEACTDLRREGILTPIVILTSKNFQEDADRATAAGANAYLLKPFDPKKLEEVIAPLLR